MRKWTVLWVVLVGLALALGLSRCAKSTNPYEPGRVFLFCDVDPSRVKGWIGWGPGESSPRKGHFAVYYEVEGEEPVELELVQDEVWRRGYFDLVGHEIEGGRKVTVRIYDANHNVGLSFTMDGNVKLKFYLLNPETTGDESDWALVRIQ